MMSRYRHVPQESLKNLSKCFFDDQEYSDFMDALRDFCMRVARLSTDEGGDFSVTPKDEAEILARTAQFLQQNIELVRQLAETYFDEECNCCGKNGGEIEHE